MELISYKDFCNYPLSDKIDFYDKGIGSIIQSVEDVELYRFLKSTILNITENAYIRKTAISTLVELVFLKKIKERQAISICKLPQKSDNS